MILYKTIEWVSTGQLIGNIPAIWHPLQSNDPVPQQLKGNLLQGLNFKQPTELSWLLVGLNRSNWKIGIVEPLLDLLQRRLMTILDYCGQ